MRAILLDSDVFTGDCVTLALGGFWGLEVSESANAPATAVRGELAVGFQKDACGQAVTMSGARLGVWMTLTPEKAAGLPAGTWAASKPPTLSEWESIFEKARLGMKQFRVPLTHQPIHIETVLKLGTVPCDLHLKLSDQKTVRVLAEGDAFSDEDLAKYSEKKTDLLWVHPNDVRRVLEVLIKEARSLDAFQIALSNPGEVQALLDTTQNTTLRADIEQLSDLHGSADDRLTVLSGTQEHVQKELRRFGITEELQNVLRVQVQTAINAIKHDNKLAELLGRLAVEPDRYLSSHSTLLAYLACCISTFLEWHSVTTQYKLSLAAFLHDMTISDHGLARFQTLPELFGSGKVFSPEEIRGFQNHPSEAADLVADLPLIPPDVGLIIAQHHERPDGSGFPRGLRASRISPLSAVFMISHDLLTWQMDKKALGVAKPSVLDFCSEREAVWNVGHVGKILKSIQAAAAAGKFQ